MQLELPADLHERVKALAAKGDVLAKNEHFEDAIRTYNEAWSQIPEPKNEWEASTWLLAAIGDACFLGGFYASGVDAFAYTLECPGGFGNPFVHLRLGQCQLEGGAEDAAAEHLTRAYSLAGAELLEGESAKYFEFLKTRIAPPAGGVW
jgi:tetratricopeptide (TPR) repeat protein